MAANYERWLGKIVTKTGKFQRHARDLMAVAGEDSNRALVTHQLGEQLPGA